MCKLLPLPSDEGYFFIIVVISLPLSIGLLYQQHYGKTHERIFKVTHDTKNNLRYLQAVFINPLDIRFLYFLGGISVYQQPYGRNG